jgi:hypothetical protein
MAASRPGGPGLIPAAAGSAIPVMTAPAGLRRLAGGSQAITMRHRASRVRRTQARDAEGGHAIILFHRQHASPAVTRSCA